MACVGIALGSNMGNKLAHLRAAREFLEQLQPRNAKLLYAPLFQSCPVNCPKDSPDFYNTAVEIIYEGTPEQLLAKTQEIERQLGRLPKTKFNEPRPIDVDILYYDDFVVHTEALQLPHPRMAQRRFVLEPLSEICPHRILPNETLTILDLLECLDSSEPPLRQLQTTW